MGLSRKTIPKWPSWGTRFSAMFKSDMILMRETMPWRMFLGLRRISWQTPSMR